MENYNIADKDVKRFIDEYWLNLGDTSKIFTPNIFGTNQLFKENPTLGLIDVMRRPENFAFTCQFLLNIKLLPFQVVILKQLWTNSFPMLVMTRGGSKTFLLAIYALLLSLFKPGSKIVITGSAFRQSKIMFSYIENIWKNAPMLRDILSDDKNNRPSHDTDMYSFTIGPSSIVSIPLGDGSKVRGLRASCLLADEFNSMDINIFEEVLRGFTSVSLNPAENVVEHAKLEALKAIGRITDEQFNVEQGKISSNQIILSGTPGYTFENLYKYWKRYRDIILTRGNEDKLRQLFNGEIPEGFNWRDYCIIRVPYTLLPKKFMDDKAIGQAQATSATNVFISEYQSVFLTDSNGFFKRTLIENCVCMNTKPPVSKPSCGVVQFNTTLRGSRDKKYVIACDPAAAQDNLAIVVIEVWGDHRRIVYCWTINEKKHKQRIKYGLAKEHDYYRYCGRKIRDLMRVFPCENVVVDAQGGGQAIKEVLGDPLYLEAGEHPLYPIIDINDRKDTDNLPGLHILHMIQFANSEWVYEANHGLRQDMETCEIMFPLKDSLAFGLAREDDKIHNRIIVNQDEPEMEGLSDTLEDALLEIEELKNELTIIEHSKTASGRDKWDTPAIKSVGMKKGRLRKDRYSALLMANSIGRKFIARIVPQETLHGGPAHTLAKREKNSRKQGGFDIGVGVKRGVGRF